MAEVRAALDRLKREGGRASIAVPGTSMREVLEIVEKEQYYDIFY